MYSQKVILVLSLFLSFFFSISFAESSGSSKSGSGSDSETGYIGAIKCRTCHENQYQSWRETGMSRAFDLLLPGQRSEAKEKAGFDPLKDYSTDSFCLECHTTGYAKPGGFVSMDKTPELAGIQCEVCHGQGKASAEHMMIGFKSEEAKKYGLKAVNEATCLQCHNDRNPFNKEFDFETRVKAGVHKHFDKRHNHAKRGHH